MGYIQMCNRVIVVGAAALALFGFARPAFAAVSATLLASPATFNGACPTTIKFSGTITGPKGLSITYAFDRHYQPTGAQSFVTNPSITVVIPGSGPGNGQLSVNDSVPIDAAHAGSNTDQVLIMHPQGGPDYYSPYAGYTVACASGGGKLPGNLGNIKAIASIPVAPDKPTQAAVPSDCTNHGGLGGALFCLPWIQAGKLVLLWNWRGGSIICSDCITYVDAYNVYEVDGGQHKFLTALKKSGNDLAPSLAFIDIPPGGYNGKCYAVSALANGQESSDSGHFCMGTPPQGGAIVQHYNFAPNNLRVVWHHYHFDGFGPGCGLGAVGTRPGSTPFQVGFTHSYDSAAGFTCSVDNQVYQTAVGFELGSAGIVLRNSKASVQGARLLFQRTDSSNKSCLAGVHLPTVDWSNAQELISHDDYRGNIPWGQPNQSVNTGVVQISGANYSIDVGSAISDWAKGNRPNFGFLLVGGNEDTSGEDNNRCDSTFGGFSLSLDVVINP